MSLLKYVKNWLSKPYYFNPSTKFKLKISLYHGLFIFFFLYVFKPFYLSQFEVIFLEYTIGIGIIAFLGTFIILYIPALLFKNYFNEDNWTVGRNLFLMIAGVTIVGSFLWYFGEMYKEPYNLKKLGYLEFISYTFLVSLFPLSFFIFINEKNVREKREKRAIGFKNKRENIKITEVEKEVIIYSDNAKEHINFHIDKLIYITSQANYASFFIQKENGDLKEKILRATLTRIENDLKKFDTIIRCHKSYIINTSFVNDISGNARGYLLKSELIPFQVPVSRSFSKQSLQSLLK
ncbi:LytTR family transcriptional regulator DNA-binding domain-containing protein [Polaribacter aestuariivivens]|uniref:LytTR family transcriptional regulator DNA-binding domain-containing protein n=1 Tax=Polaribacter aestuariivivens TaxID=2304626 RepID=UPI003F49A6C8